MGGIVRRTQVLAVVSDMTPFRRAVKMLRVHLKNDFVGIRLGKEEASKSMGAMAKRPNSSTFVYIPIKWKL